MRHWIQRVILSVAAFAAIFVVSSALFSGQADAAINSQINFQGKLTNTDGTNVTNGTYSIRFRIYTDPSADAAVACGAGTATCKWEETQATVSVTDGVFQIALGSSTALPGSVDFNNSGLYLGIKVGADAEMTPRVRFTAAPYAFNSDKLNGLSSSDFGQLAANNVYSGTNTIQGSSASQFVVQNGSSQTLLVADTSAQRVAVGPAAVAANGVLTVGTDTTVATGGIYFGTDTNLYRSAAGTLQTTANLSIQTTSTSAFNVSDALGVSILSVDTQNDAVAISGTGGLDFNGNKIYSFGGSLYFQSPTTDLRFLALTGKMTLYTSSNTSALSLNSGGVKFNVDTLNNRTNIGGTGGTNTLNVIGGSALVQNTANGAALIVDRTDGVIGSLKAGALKIGYYFDDTGSFSIAKDTRANISAGTGAGTDLMTVLGSGNVGIGDTTPNATFTVGNGDLFQVDGATGNTSTTGALTANGTILFQNAANSTSAFQVQASGVGGLGVLTVDTSGLKVQIGNATTDANAALLILDSYNVATDPTGTDGATYYNSNLGKFRCFEGSAWKNCITSELATRSFIDTTADAIVDANTTSYWDVAAENNSSFPNITLSSTSKKVWLVASLENTATSVNDLDLSVRIERTIGGAGPAACNSGTTVGSRLSTFASNTGARKSTSVQFIDSPASTSKIWYNLCSDTNTILTGGSIARLDVTLFEIDNSNL